jgi:NADH-quinone oxidoreductase subunit L
VMYMSIMIALVSAFSSIYIYQFSKKEIYPVILSKAPSLEFLHRFLYDRWFINSIYYIVFVDSFTELYKTLGRYFEHLVIDNFYHSILTRFASVVSRGFRSIQIGFINIYLIALIIGFLIMFLIGMGVI